MSEPTIEPLPLRVTVEEIDVQREKGWPDFHPEDFCHRCGALNPSWSIDSDRFNMAMGRHAEHRWNGIICVGCFVRLHEEATGLRASWVLMPHPMTPFRPIEDLDSVDRRPAPEGGVS